MEFKPVNVATDESVKEATKKETMIKNREKEDVVHVLSSRHGRRFVWKYLSICGVFKLSADNSGSWTYFNEGQRNIGLKLLNDINETDPANYILMMKEHNEDLLNGY